MLSPWHKTGLLALTCLTFGFNRASSAATEDPAPAIKPAPKKVPEVEKIPAPQKFPAVEKIPAAVKSMGPVKGSAVATEPAAPRKVSMNQRYEAMIEVTKVYPTIFYELRYATARNFTHQQIYPTGARCLLRKSVALRLQHAQEELRRQGYGLKIWDAYRPAWAHEVLWEASPDPEFVAAPSAGGSWHSWGAAVDVTLVDLKGREQKMPTDFDDFTHAAKSEYRGGDREVAAHAVALRTAMLGAGFRGLRDEWWHFTAEDANHFCPVKMALVRGGRK